MPYPTGMATFQKTFGPAYALGTGETLQMVVAVTPSTSVVWAASATPLVAFVPKEGISAAAGLQGILTLPSPDQDGFIDGAGNTVRNWTYNAEISFFNADGNYVGGSRTTFTYLTGGPTPSDLEGSIPVPGTTGQRVAITVPTSAEIDGNDLVLFDISGNEMFRGDVRGPAGSNAFDGGTEY